MKAINEKIVISIIDEFQRASQRPDAISLKINTHVLDCVSDDTADRHMADIMEATFELNDALIEGKNGADEQLKLAAAYSRVATYVLSQTELEQTFPATKALFDTHKDQTFGDDIDKLRASISP